jgi:hypothetical protein
MLYLLMNVLPCFVVCGVHAALFFGYSTALLGITGFETAANYVEQMKDNRVYKQTLRNMWILVSRLSTHSVAWVFKPCTGIGCWGILVVNLSRLTVCGNAYFFVGCIYCCIDRCAVVHLNKVRISKSNEMHVDT